MKFTEKLFHFNDYTKYFSRPKLRLKLSAFFAYVLTHATYVSGFALYAERQLGFDATHVGYLLTYVGAISVVLRGVLLGRLIDKFGERILQYVGMAGVLSGMMLLPFADVPLFIAAMTLFAVGTGISRPVLTGNISRNVTDKEQGRVLGVTSSLASLSQIFGPLIGGFAIQYFFPGSLGLIAACFTALGIVLIYKDDRKRKDIKGEHSI